MMTVFAGLGTAKSLSDTTIPSGFSTATDLADYREVSGVKQPFAITVNAPGQVVKIALSKVEFNTPLDDAMFSRPAVK